MKRSIVVGTVAILLAGCDDTVTGNPHGEHLTLSGGQAVALQERVAEIAPLHADLAWLADSASLVLRAGAVADRVVIQNDVTGSQFFGVTIQRRVCGAGCSTTWHLIAFDDPANATTLVVVSGWASPAGVHLTGSIGASTNQQLSVHVFHVSGGGLTAWHATSGSVSLISGTTSGGCGLEAPMPEFVTCMVSGIDVGFDVDLTRESGPTAPAIAMASLAPTSVRGIALSFNFP